MDKSSRSFRPGLHVPRKKRSNHEKDFEFKGDSFDMDKVDAYLAEMRAHSDTKIKSLSPDLLDKYNYLVTNVNLFYSTKEYDKLKSLVTKHFGGIQGMRPGTVAAYFAGCLIKTTMTDRPGCSAVCAGGMPPSIADAKVSGWQSCPNTVILAEYQHYCWSFTVTKQGSTNDKSILMVNFTSTNSFPGFNEAEKAKLKAMGVNNVDILGYSNDGKSYHVMYENTPLDQVKSRVQMQGGNIQTNAGFQMSERWIFGIIIFLLIIGVLFGLGAWYNRGKKDP